MAPDQPLLKRVWGEAATLLNRTPRVAWIDILAIVCVAGLLYGLMDLAREWTGEHRPTVEIDLSPWALPRYTFFSLTRGVIAYGISLVFTLVYGYWAAKDHTAERVLIPLLDILQSIPVLAIMPPLVLALVYAFPNSNIGLELAAVVMIFTGQAWNMTFSFYHSVRSVPQDLREVATIYRFKWWEVFRWVELPFSTIGLVWNSMMSMAGGWFFLMVIEAFQLGDQDFRLPGIGSYMSVAVDKGDTTATLWAILAMIVMILALDQLFWRPVVVWAQKFRVEDAATSDAMSSWFLNLLRRSRLLTVADRWLSRLGAKRISLPLLSTVEAAAQPVSSWTRWLSLTFFLLLLALLAVLAGALVSYLPTVGAQTWREIGSGAVLTLARVLASITLGTFWAVPAGLAIGLSSRLSRSLQPVVQVVASFPAPMLFSIVFLGLLHFGITLNWSSIALMLLGTQWYILFNVIAGAMAIPADLREAATSYGITGWQRFRILHFPGVFPYLVTGWITAAGGAWNASIVAEYGKYRGEVFEAHGLGAMITTAAADKNIPVLVASVVVMSAMVIVFNRTVWRRCYQLAETRFSLNR